MIIFDKVSKQFGTITALEDISFCIEKGEFVFLTGQSGAGKSTIIKLILVEYLPTKGEIVVLSEKVSKIPKRKLPLWRSKIGTVFQDYKLLNDLTVYENVCLPLNFRKIDKGKIKKKAKEVLEQVGLIERMSLFPSQLAGGELQRTCLARAIVNDSEILLADEPTGNLDPKTSEGVIKLLLEINKNGTTVLMATHNNEIVDLYKARVIELDKGKLIRDEKEGKYHV